MARENIAPPILISKEPGDWKPIVDEWIGMDVIDGGSETDWDWSQSYDKYLDYLFFLDTDGPHDGQCIRCMLTVNADEFRVFASIEVNCNTHDTGCPYMDDRIKLAGEKHILHALYSLTEHLNRGLREAGLGDRFKNGGFTWVGR